MCTLGKALITTRNEQIQGFIDSFLGHFGMLSHCEGNGQVL